LIRRAGKHFSILSAGAPCFFTAEKGSRIGEEISKFTKKLANVLRLNYFPGF
jgi:hypothetical protein